MTFVSMKWVKIMKKFPRQPINKEESLAANSTKFNQIFDMVFPIRLLCLLHQFFDTGSIVVVVGFLLLE